MTALMRSTKNTQVGLHRCGSGEDREERTSFWDATDVFELPRPKNFSFPFSSVLKKAEQLSLFVDIDPEILGGTPRIDDTRIPVYMVLNAIHEHGSIQGARRVYRSLT